MNKEILDIAEMLQCEAQDYAKQLVSDKVSYQDAINTWMYLKLAELLHKANTQTSIGSKLVILEFSQPSTNLN